MYNQRAMLYEQVITTILYNLCLLLSSYILPQKGSIESAIEDYQTMVDIDPSDSSAILKMGMHHFNKKFVYAYLWCHARLRMYCVLKIFYWMSLLLCYIDCCYSTYRMWSAASQNFTLLVERDASNTTARIHRAQAQWKLVCMCCQCSYVCITIFTISLHIISH